MRASSLSLQRSATRNFEGWCTLCEEGKLTEAVELAEKLDKRGIPLTRNGAYYILQACEKGKNLEYGMRVQSVMSHHELISVSVLGDHLIRLFSNCGKLVDASQAFTVISKPSSHTWPAIISAYAKLGEGWTALELYRKGMQVDKHIVLAVFKASTMALDIRQGRLVHAQLSGDSLQLDIELRNTIIDMYAKCGSLFEADGVFSRLLSPTIVTWNVMIAGYAQQKEGYSALNLFYEMQKYGMIPDKVTFLSALKVCYITGEIERGRSLHCQIMEQDLQSNIVLGNTLIDMYAKCGGLEEAQTVFNTLKNRDVVSWGAIIGGYAQRGESCLALEHFEHMQHDGIEPTAITFLCILKACGNVGALQKGRSIHRQIVKSGINLTVELGNALIDMYSKCGVLKEARALFDELSSRDLVSWSIMIGAYAQHGEGIVALDCFWEMQECGLKPINITFLAALKACSSMGAISYGRLIHDQIIKSGLQSDASVGSTLVDIYAKCGGIEEARSLFDKLIERNVVSWGIIILAYVENGECVKALDCFEEMQSEGIDSNDIAFSSIVKACASLNAIHQGRLIHNQIIEMGLKPDIIVGTNLINMYISCGSLEEAYKVFECLPNHDVVSWGSMIMGLVQHGDALYALELFEQMEKEALFPDLVTYLGTLKACGNIGATVQGKLIHEQIIGASLQFDVDIGSTLVDMYAKNGNLEMAAIVFNRLPRRNIILWGTMIAGYAQHGKSCLAIECFEMMQVENIEPDEVSFTNILVACSHVGLVDEGCWYFKSMKAYYGITPSSAHYTCLVDLLGHVGYLAEAEDLLLCSSEPNISGWTSLLSACHNYGHVALARHCFHWVTLLDSDYAPAYVLMANTYANPHAKHNAAHN